VSQGALTSSHMWMAIARSRRPRGSQQPARRPDGPSVVRFDSGRRRHYYRWQVRWQHAIDTPTGSRRSQSFNRKGRVQSLGADDRSHRGKQHHHERDSGKAVSAFPPILKRMRLANGITEGSYPFGLDFCRALLRARARASQVASSPFKRASKTLPG